VQIYRVLTCLYLFQVEFIEFLKRRLQTENYKNTSEKQSFTPLFLIQEVLRLHDGKAA